MFYAKVTARAHIIVLIVHIISHSLKYALAFFGRSWMRPLVMSVIINKNMNAKGRAIVLLTRDASVIRTMPINPPNIRKQRIIITFNTCLILSIFIKSP